MLVLLLSGCDPCHSWKVSDVRFDDESIDQRVRDRMRATVREFYEASDATDACIDEVRIEPELREAYEIDQREIALHPLAAVSEFWVRAALCEVLDDERAYSARAGDDFIWSCAAGPGLFEFADDVLAACGANALEPVDTFVRSHVWNDVRPDHGVLDLKIGEARQYSGFPLVSVAGLDEHVATVSFDRDAKLGSLALIDPWTGASAATVDVPDLGKVYGATDQAVLAAYDDGAMTLTTLDVSGASNSVTTEYLDLNTAGVLGDTLFAAGSAWDEQQSLITADLGTGAVGAIEYPAAPEGLLSLGYVEGVSTEQLLMRVNAATVDVHCGHMDCVIYVVIFHEQFVFYDPGTGTWRDVDGANDFYFAAVGTTTDGTFVGTIRAAPGNVFAAWDPIAGTMAVADEVCAEQNPDFAAVTGDTAWWSSRGDDDTLELVPVELTIDW